MIIVVDYGLGNLESVIRSLARVKVDAKASSSIVDIERAEKLILPGVGHFSSGMQYLRDRGLIDVLNYMVLSKGIPVLGICLGMQLFANYSEEGNASGLGWVNAEVRRLRPVNNDHRWKIPHMGWNSINKKNESCLISQVKTDDKYYFVHSYQMICKNNSDVIATTNYKDEFVSVVQKGNIYGTQFHPEKSHEAGLLILKNFVSGK